MRYCKHTRWLGSSMHDGEFSLQNTDRLETLLEDLPDPDEQKPSLFVFFGNKSKAMAIKGLASSIFPPTRYDQVLSGITQQDDKAVVHGAPSDVRRNCGEINLHLQCLSAFSDRPVLLAEGDLPSVDRPRDMMIGENCHETKSRTLPSSTLPRAADGMYFKLLSPFTDVFCFFASDFGSLRPIARRLAAWLNLGQPSLLPSTTRPKVLIVTELSERDPGISISELRIFKRMLREETAMDHSAQFSDIQVLNLTGRDKNLSNKSRHRELFESLLKFSDQVRRARLETKTLFSANHFAAFFALALDHIATLPFEPFNFVSTSRRDNPVAKDLQEHLVEFLGNVKSAIKLQQFAIPTIASSIILDNFLPGIHHFRAVDVFRTLYMDICYQVGRTGVLAYQGSTHMLLPSRFTRILEDEILRQEAAFTKSSSTLWHQRILHEAEQDWTSVFSSRTCLICLRTRPQFGLPCGHIICETCFKRHGTRCGAWTFELDHCLLCGQSASGLSIKVIPPTASLRLLSIDGGGARGIIPLMFLRALEDRIGLPCPVQENFHFAFGTSSGMKAWQIIGSQDANNIPGGINVLALCHNGMSVEECIYAFERLAKQAFALHPLLYLKAIIMSLFTDRIYPTRNIEAPLMEVFGDQKILGYSRAALNGTKIGVIASTMKPEPFLFTNYNSLGRQEDKRRAGYKVLVGDALVREIARCTSAAPGIFTSKTILDLGKFQDGGLTQNNPLRIALKEIKSLFPRDPSAKSSTLKVSLGTGKVAAHDPELYGSTTWWRDLWFFRLFRALWSASDDVGTDDVADNQELDLHEEQVADNKKRGETFRFNIEFADKQPTLDDSSKIPDMKLQVQDAILSSKNLDRLAQTLVAELFVFELESSIIPRKENGVYSCTGYIMCIHEANSLVLAALLEKLSMSSATFLLRGRPLPGMVADRLSLAKDGGFKKRVCFTVTSLDQQISIQLHERGLGVYHISGSPFSVNWLVEAQGMRCFFGRPDGQRRKRKASGETFQSKRRRL